MDIGLGKDFWDMTLKGQATDTKMGKWDYIRPEEKHRTAHRLGRYL